ncbi:plasmid mobilization relaxosome protein MobC [Paeniglutamicibacter cryotolerans]|uniref:plasmid mobilization relaxosome protein MobC n=1 Tax=Paeniglutamicibacter cryotolerans TaxID=670079 RepID=UPI0016206403
MWVTAEEDALLVARAEREGVTVPRLLIAAAVSENVETPLERRAMVAELFAIHTLLARVSNNVNQLARHANAGDEFPVEAAATLAYVRRLAFRISDTVEGIRL